MIPFRSRRDPKDVLAAETRALERLRLSPPQPSGMARMAHHLAALEAAALLADREVGHGDKIREEIVQITRVVTEGFTENLPGVRLTVRRECPACGMAGAVFFRCTGTLDDCAVILCDNCRNMAGNGGHALCAKCQGEKAEVDEVVPEADDEEDEG